jgi:hypothetical protein
MQCNTLYVGYAMKLTQDNTVLLCFVLALRIHITQKFSYSLNYPSTLLPEN